MSTSELAPIPDRLVSTLLLDDPEMSDLVEEFVAGLYHRMEAMRQAYQQLDWDRLAVLAHQLKGAGGSYGYAELSAFARKLELTFRDHCADRFADWMVHFEKLIAAARSGLQPEQASGT